ncbi:TlpA family protein disulfide reductase [Winogradskyella aurantiaca]|uniref:TlpA family protein disulfide reductase n=1 Tax=Winogradskyella aurantiaca TaxID=2219558 RepID=UPI000E1C5D99|nr:TlpA disulfide reductase family protein [Winogradskyella aurantiaca]
MKYLLLCICVLVMSCKKEAKTPVASTNTKETVSGNKKNYDNLPFEVYDYDGLAPLINKEDDKIHVVNFWATWCAPCIKELPYFEQIGDTYKKHNLELLLVSLDFPRKYESKLVPFLEKHDLKSTVVALDDVDQNRWIPAIDSTWSGALPATIIYKNGKRKFYERSFTYEELETEIKEFIN